MTRRAPKSSPIKLIARDGKLLVGGGAERAVDGPDFAAPPLSDWKEDTSDGALKWMLHPSLLVEFACCLIFAVTIVVVGCIYIVTTDGLLPIILQNNELIW
ncbi:hypothetical protein ACK9YZ_31240 [Rhizobium sp. ZK1]|uniref:hypothetical protein n=1 Tax=Rhizobium sp. ZK1 TaxID=3389872 RepID=UPI0039F72F51